MENREVFERQLALTERRISELEHHIARQRGVIASLESAGRGGSETAEIARDLLRTMEFNVRRELGDRRRLRAALGLSEEQP